MGIRVRAKQRRITVRGGLRERDEVWKASGKNEG